MAEPDAIFKNGGYINVNEGQMYVGIYRYPPSYPIVQFTMYRLNFSFTFFGHLQNYTFLESLEPTEPEK